MVTSIFVFNKMANVSSCKVTVETKLHIFDFFRGESVVIVKCRVVDEFLVEHRLQEKLEITHEAGVVAILVLAENGKQSVVPFLANRVLFGLFREVEVEFDK